MASPPPLPPHPSGFSQAQAQPYQQQHQRQHQRKTSSPALATSGSGTPPAPPPKQSPLLHQPSGSLSQSPSHMQQAHPAAATPGPYPTDPRSNNTGPQHQQQWDLSLLQTYDSATLSSLLASPSAIAAFANHPEHGNPVLASSRLALQQGLQANVELAQALNSLEAELETLRTSTGARLLTVRAQEQQFRRVQGQMEAALAPFGPRVLHQRLAASVLEQQHELDAVEHSWLDQHGIADEREVADWLKKVADGTTRVTLRKERKARWDEGRVGGWR